MSLHDFIKILRQRWWVILLCTFVAAGAMFAATPARTDTTQRIGSYTATTTLLVGHRAADPEPTRPGSPAPSYERVSLPRISLFITTGEVPRRAAAKLNYTGDPAVLASGLTVVTDVASESITISTTAADGNRAASVANTFAEEAVAFFADSPPGAGRASLTILQEATPIPNRSTAGFVIPPDRNLRTALAALVGLLVGLSAALLLDRLDSRLRTRAEVAEALRMPVIAEVPRLRRSERRQGQILTRTKPLSVYADGYRAARTALMHLPSQQVPGEWSPRRAEGSDEPVTQSQVILLSSAHAAEGKTTSVANLAASFAETGKRVLVVDADLRSPDTHLQFDVPQGAGISDYLTNRGAIELADIMRPTNVDGVRIVTAGTRLDYPASLTSRLAPLMAEARQRADIVLVDTAPLLAASDVFDILPLADAIVVVVRAGRLTENAAHRVAELLGRFRVPVTGAILIGGHMRKADYGYGYGYGEGASRSRGRRSERGATRASVAPRDDDAWAATETPRAPSARDGMVSRVFGSAGALILTLVGVVWYVRLLTQVMDTGSYNTWGAMFLVPVVIALNAVLISQAIRREAEPWFARIIVLAFLAKLVGISARYFVAYFLYGGQADAQAYNLYAINHYLDWRAGEVWWEGSGKLGTLAMELMTTALYVVIGPSVITAFFIFGSMAFWGVYLTYRAFRIALPQGDYRRYAILIFFLPTVLYWPASIGKESWLMLFVGVTALGAARYFNHAVTCRLPA